MPKREHIMDLLPILSLVLPTGVLDNFDIERHTIDTTRVDLYLVEKLILPDGFIAEDIISHGYHQEVTIQDFPLRDKSLYLHIKRRRWLIKSSQQVISRDLSFIAVGTRISQEFATFLKGVY